MKPSFGWTRRFERRARVKYNLARRRYAKPGQLMQWTEWLRTCEVIGAHVCAGAPARRKKSKGPA
jgi:hypothetical protein